MTKSKTKFDATLMAAMLERFIPHCREIGMTMVSATPGRTVLKLPYDARLVGDPETGVIMGGAITTLIDTAGGMSVNMALGEPTSVATLDLRIDYLRPATPGETLFAAAECYRLTRHVAFVKARAWAGETLEAASNPVAECLGTFMIGDASAASGTAGGTAIGPRAGGKQP